jgi:hypothetical protein
MPIRELPPWLKRVGPWVVAVVLGFISVYLVSITPSNVLDEPIYVAGLIAWAIAGRLFLPTRQGIPRRRPGRGPLLGWTLLSVLMLATVAISRFWQPFVPMLYGFTGFPLGIAAFLAYDLSRNSKLRPCQKCGTFRYFFREGSGWFCAVCGQRLLPRPPEPAEGVRAGDFDR